MRIGVDVGGTNTDAVLMDGSQLLASCKEPTTPDVSSGIVNAVTKILAAASISPASIKCVMIGTTHFTNAFVERKHLMQVGVVRICLPAANGIPPLVDWPEDLRSIIGNNIAVIRGGYQFDGRLNTELDIEALKQCAKNFCANGITTVAITGLFSTVKNDMEIEAAKIIRQEMGEVSISLSNEVGRAGILERENAAIMNACLANLSTSVVRAFRDALKSLDIEAPFFISQNDGTLLTASHVEKYPVLTFASGPTNSMRGAAYLSGVKEAIVADIGVTTTDIGMLINGFPRESSVTVDIGGVRTNFRMPDVFALGLGGGTIIESKDGNIKIGPQSVGYKLTEEALVFGGKTLTTTDITVAAGKADIGDRKLLDKLNVNVPIITDRIHQMIEDGIDRMKTNTGEVPLILVGGGSILIHQQIKGASETLIPENAGVANAIGASIAQVAAELDTIVHYLDNSRDEILDAARQKAIKKAIALGAIEQSIEIIDIEETPLAYAPDGAVRLRIKAAGSLDIDSINNTSA